jgi:DNA-binding transcriptional regulator YiaG
MKQSDKEKKIKNELIRLKRLNQKLIERTEHLESRHVELIRENIDLSDKVKALDGEIRNLTIGVRFDYLIN